MQAKPKWTIGVLLFDGVDVLDFTAPAEVFAVAAYTEEDAVAMLMKSAEGMEKPFVVQTVSRDGKMVQGSNGLRLVPDFRFENAPDFDIVLVPGAFGEPIQKAVENMALLTWLSELAGRAKLFVSVCTGALLLAAAGLLEGKPATTNVLALDFLQQTFPNVQVVRNARVVDAGNVITGQGPSTGIDVALHVVERLLGSEAEACAAATIEYRGILRHPQAR